MARIYESISELIGKTPLLKLSSFQKKFNTGANILAKLEFFNPSGSVKDRAAEAMLSDAYDAGKINAETLIIEPTSGNTGIGISAICAARGLHAVIVMPKNMSAERIMLMRAYGAEVVLTDANLGMQGAIDKAEELHEQNQNSIIAGQFVNSANAQAHYKTTGPEI